jgi:hypothetical protein
MPSRKPMAYRHLDSVYATEPPDIAHIHEPADSSARQTQWLRLGPPDPTPVKSVGPGMVGGERGFEEQRR